jgi:hypothetical protein
MIASPGKDHWLFALAWLGAAAALVAAADVLPPWATIALAAGLFAVRVFLPHPDAACRAPGRVTNDTSADP